VSEHFNISGGGAEEALDLLAEQYDEDGYRHDNAGLVLWNIP